MMLLIDFPQNMVTKDLLGQVEIPCLCKVSDKFEVHFFDSTPESDGLIVEWDRRELELRAVPGVGGEYSHHALGLITIREVSEGTYEVVDLELFSSMFGWCPVMISGQYAPPGRFWDKE